MSVHGICTTNHPSTELGRSCGTLLTSATIEEGMKTYPFRAMLETGGSGVRVARFFVSKVSSQQPMNMVMEVTFE